MQDYNNFSHTFAKSRKNMKWEEIEYFMNFLQKVPVPKDLGTGTQIKILDIGCGSGRLINYLDKIIPNLDNNYL